MAPLSYSYLVDGLKWDRVFGDTYFFTDGICQAMDRLGVKGAVGEHMPILEGPFLLVPNFGQRPEKLSRIGITIGFAR